jgi:hypothetical protein
MSAAGSSVTTFFRFDDMGSPRARFSESTIKKWIAEERGQGHGPKYKPWLMARDVPSKGYVNRILGWKTKRRHEFLSNLEANYFYLLDWSPVVTDCREQFPLDRNETLAIAKRCGIEHPTIPGTGEPTVMTTDFLVDITTHGSTTEHARTIKPAQYLSSERIIEKFEIERRYWLRRNVDWAIVTERDIPQVLVNNIQWLHRYYDISSGLDVSPDEIIKAEKVLSELLHQNLPLNSSSNSCDDRLGLKPGTSLALVRHFLATRRWLIDMNEPIDPRQPIKVLRQSAEIYTDNGVLKKHAA